jgi:hypothetical protein
MKGTWFVVNISYTMNTWSHLQVLDYSNKIINIIMLIIYNPIEISFVCGFQFSNKNSLYYTYLKYH